MKRAALFLGSILFCGAGAAETQRLTLNRLESMDYAEVSPWIADFYLENPALAASEPILQKFCVENPPKELLPRVRKTAPNLYKILKKTSLGGLPPAKQEQVRVKDLLALPGSEIVFVVNLIGEPVHQLLMTREAEMTIDTLLPPDDGQARQLATTLLTEARQVTPDQFARQALLAIGMLKASKRF